MKKRLLFFLLMLAGSVGAMSETMPGIIVSYADAGTPDYKQSLSAIGRILLSNGNAVLVFKDSEAGQYELGSLSDIKRITLEGVVATKNISSKVSVVAYPNPTSDRIRINGLEENETVRLFSSDGKLVYIGHDSEISLANQKADTYILQVGKEIVKIIKK